MTDEERARWYWDSFIGPGLRVDGLPEDAIDGLREQYVKNVLGRPYVLAELRQQFPDK